MLMLILLSLGRIQGLNYSDLRRNPSIKLSSTSHVRRAEFE